MVDNKNVNRSRQYVSTLHQYEQIKSSSKHKQRINEASASSKLAPNTPITLLADKNFMTQTHHLGRQKTATYFYHSSNKKQRAFGFAATVELTQQRRKKCGASIFRWVCVLTSKNDSTVPQQVTNVSLIQGQRVGFTASFHCLPFIVYFATIPRF